MNCIKRVLKDYQSVINKGIDYYLPTQEKLPPLIHDSMRYSALSDGKRIRPILLLETCKMLSGSFEQALPTAVAVEMAHCFTLIHDDLPSIDNDDLRRGMPTNHKLYGEAIALLAGDALIIDAFRIISKYQEPKDLVHKVIMILSESLSSKGVIGGQVADILAEKETLEHNLELLKYIHTNKTAKLIQASIALGAIIGGASDKETDKLSKAGLYLGLAFQIKDDILDIEGDVVTLGKNIGRDQLLGKLTYPKIIGLEQSKEELEILRKMAFDQVSDFVKSNNLKLIFEFLINRNY
jgi:geranylgeranyl diphosphate synthase type II